MNKQQLLKNVATSIVQVVSVGLVMFWLYRFIAQQIGATQFGLWSLVFSITSLMQVANLGMGGAVVKYVAKYLAREDRATVAQVLETSLTFTALAMASLLALIYPLISHLLPRIVEPASLDDALIILPYAMVSIWLVSMLSVFYGGLEGFQRLDIRSGLMMFGSYLYAVLCWFFLGFLDWGLIGLAYANVIQYLILLTVSALALRRLIKLPILPHHWNRNRFREMLRYSLNYQAAGFIAAASDPITKAMLSNFGGLASVGYYTMAYNIVSQFRSLIVTANRALVPAFADLAERSPARIWQVYSASLRVAFFFSAPMYAAIIISAPLLSNLMLGSVESQFVLAVICIAAGLFVTTLSAPAYLAYLGSDSIHWNTVSEILIVVLIVLLGPVLGRSFGVTGVLIGWTLSNALGSIVSPIAYHLEYRQSLRVLWGDENVVLAVACLLAVITSYILAARLKGSISVIGQTLADAMLFVLITYLPIKRHSVLQSLHGLVHQRLGRTG